VRSMRARELRADFDAVADSIVLTGNSGRQRLFLPERHDSHVQKTARRRYGARGSNTCTVGHLPAHPFHRAGQLLAVKAALSEQSHLLPFNGVASALPSRRRWRPLQGGLMLIVSPTVGRAVHGD
jgi:hypothetical protein